MLKFRDLFAYFPNKFGITRVKDFYVSLFCLSCFGIARNLYCTFTNLELHTSESFGTTLTSLSTSTDLLGALAMVPFFPLLSRKFSFKQILITSSFLQALISLLFIFFLDSQISFLLRFGIGLATGLFYTAINCYFSLLFDTPHRAVLFSFSYILLNVSFAIGASLMALFPTIVPVYTITSFFFTICIVLFFFLSTSPQIVALSYTPRKKSPLFSLIFLSVPSLFIFSLLTGLAFYWHGQYLTIFGSGIGLIPSHAGWLSSFSLLGIIVVFPIASLLADSYGFLKVFVCLGLLGALLSFVALFITSTEGLALLFFFISPMATTTICLVTPWVAKTFKDPFSLSVAMSLRGLFLRTGGLLSPLLFGFCLATYGPYSYLYALGAGFLLGSLTLGALFFIPSKMISSSTKRLSLRSRK